ncbi:MAG: thermonuclease family protein [Candidatus Aenigmarchaeota archaeon]|nr:thermonuclease family protein [Candidatus Aenigmarchaeota archaeon]
MRRRIFYMLVVVLIVVIYSVYFAVPTGYLSDSYELEETVVTKVVDGDTIVIQGGQRIRLLNIDARERGENCYKEAKEMLEELVLLKNVTLERDNDNKDRYGRLLRHVYVGNLSANLELVKKGLAVAYIYEPNIKYLKAFRTAEEQAKQEGGCVWTELP